MLFKFFAVAAVLSLVWLAKRMMDLRANIAKARTIGLAYVVLPCSHISVPWLLFRDLLRPLIQSLPSRWHEDWFFLLIQDWGYCTGQTHFERLGDTFVSVSPTDIVVYTQSPSVIDQITRHRDGFPKELKPYKVLSSFGDNLVNTEGADWRFHRKHTGPAFNDKNVAYTYTETIFQAQSLLTKWKAVAGSDAPAIKTLAEDTLLVSLNVISFVGFGVRLPWPGQPRPRQMDARMDKYGTPEPTPGYAMTVAEALRVVASHLVPLMLIPGWLLAFLGRYTDSMRQLSTADWEFRAYMRDFIADKLAAAKEGATTPGLGLDLMGQLVRSRCDADNADNAADNAETQKSGERTLSDDEIIGNAFIFLFAGHETTGGTLHFTLAHLAMHPAVQIAVQADIDRLLGRDSAPDDWDYEGNVQALYKSMVYAAVCETLRLMPPVVMLLRKAAGPEPQPLVLPETGQTLLIPPGVWIAPMIVSVQRHPRYWPSAKDEPNDAHQWNPERWFRPSSADADADAESADFYRPVPGSYVPFSAGRRICTGRRISQIELLTTLAVIFQRYSIELAVETWADDAAVAAMNDVERVAVYCKAQERAAKVIGRARSVVTLCLQGKDHVPVRLVPRGQERFLHLME